MEQRRPFLQIVGYQRAGYRAGIIETVKVGIGTAVGIGLLHIGYQLVQWGVH